MTLKQETLKSFHNYVTDKKILFNPTSDGSIDVEFKLTDEDISNLVELEFGDKSATREDEDEKLKTICNSVLEVVSKYFKKQKDS